MTADLEVAIAETLVKRGLRAGAAVKAAAEVLRTIEQDHDIIPHATKRLLHRLRMTAERRKGD